MQPWAACRWERGGPAVEIQHWGQLEYPLHLPRARAWTPVFARAGFKPRPGCVSLGLLVDSPTCGSMDGQWAMPVTRADGGYSHSMGGMESETQGLVRPLLLLVPSVPSSSWGSLSPSTALPQEKGVPDLAAWG